MEKENKVGQFRFVNPHPLGHVTGKEHDKKWCHEQMENRSRFLADRLSGTPIGQMVLVPVNVGYVNDMFSITFSVKLRNYFCTNYLCVHSFHWILTVIDPHNEDVYLFDPLSHRNRFEEWKLAVNL